jgi:hypothetical protein
MPLQSLCLRWSLSELLKNQQLVKTSHLSNLTLCVTFCGSLTIIDQYFGMNLTVL